MRRAHVGSLVFIAACALVPPAVAAPGLRLSWDHCAADGEVSLDIAATSETLPAWWYLQNVTGCRSTALGILAVPPGPSACVDLLGDQAYGAIGQYAVGVDGPNIARLTAGAFAPAPGFDATISTEYFGFALTIRNFKTVGSGACGGCTTPMCIGLVEIHVLSAVGHGENDLDLLGGLESGVTFQGAHFLQFDVERQPARANSTIVCLAQDVPTRGETWGRLKALYR